MVHLSDFRYDSRIQRQARALAERGDTVDLVCVGEAGHWRVGDGSITAHPVTASKPSGSAATYLRSYGGFLVGAARRLTTLDRARAFDLVEVHNMPNFLTFSALGVRVRGTPLILNMHDTFPELFSTRFGVSPHHPMSKLLRLEERVSAALADRVVTITDQARRRIVSRGVGAGRALVVMNSPDESVFGPPRAPSPVPPHGTVRLLYHGGTARRFGVETLIRAVSLTLARVELRVCGSGEERSALAALAEQVAPGRIDVSPEPVPFAAIPDELRRAHIGVVPTLSDEFTELLLPVKLLEYVHMGLPVIASRLAGITSYFSAQELRLFEPGSVPALADAISEVCGDPETALRRAGRASERLAEFRWERQRAQYLDLVDDLVASRREGPRSSHAAVAMALSRAR